MSEVDEGTVPNLRFSFADAHTRRERGGWAREVTERELPVATALAGVNMRLEAGAVRELHWHQQAEWHFPAEPPGPLDGTAADRRFSHRLLAQQPVEVPGGRVRIADSGNFGVSTTVAAALVEVDPGGLRELHWHPNADEWQYYIEGAGRMTVFAASGRARTFDYRARDVGYVPFAMGHYVENTGQRPLRFLELFRSDRFADVSLARWLALTPPELVRAHLGADVAGRASAQKRPVVR